MNAAHPRHGIETPDLGVEAQLLGQTRDAEVDAAQCAYACNHPHGPSTLNNPILVSDSTAPSNLLDSLKARPNGSRIVIDPSGRTRMMANRFVLVLFGWLATLIAAPQSAQAQANYPNRTIKIVVGFAAGGGNDIIARIIGQKLQEALGQPVIIENKPGAGGRLSAAYVASQPADGHTLLIGAAGAMAISPAVYEKMNYVTLRDFIPISMIASFPLILAVHPSNPAKTVQEFVAAAKANPDKSNYATSSVAFTL